MGNLIIKLFLSIYHDPIFRQESKQITLKVILNHCRIDLTHAFQVSIAGNHVKQYNIEQKELTASGVILLLYPQKMLEKTDSSSRF